MKSRAVSGIMLTLLLISMLTLAFNIQPVRASGTIYIRPDGSVEGTDKIQRDGDTYTFTDNIYDEIVVERDNIVVDGAGCTLQGTGSGTGIYLSYRSNVTIKNAEIIEFWDGVKLRYSSNNSVFGNNITANNGLGIGLWWSSNNAISGNTVSNNLGHGIVLWESSNYNTVSGNNITANKYTGIDLTDSSNNAISGNTVTANNWYGIALGGSSNNALSRNNITANKYTGIGLWVVFKQPRIWKQYNSKQRKWHPSR